ncbi:amidohydrolase [Actinoplanes sp. NBRC 103695]|nr:amidohydrolase [Actinoplanes sp. NBRC 103695]
MVIGTTVETMPISRRELLAGAAGVVVAAPAVTLGRPVEAGTGTDIAARVSPDGRWIAMDLVGVLWVLPSSGGPARRLTGDLYDIGQPDWAPDGRSIAFQSYRDSSFGIWTIRPDGGGLRRLTTGPYDYREPRFAPDGRRIVVSSDRGGSYGLWLLDVASGEVTPLVDQAGQQEYEPAWSPDGGKVAFVVDNTRIDVLTVASGVRQTAVTVPAGRVIHAPEWTPDGAELIHNVSGLGRSELWRGNVPLVTGEDVFPFRVSWRSPSSFVYTAGGEIRRSTGGRIGFVAPLSVTRPSYRKRQRDFDSPLPRPVRGLGSPAVSPDGRTIAFRALNDIYLMPIGKAPRPLTRDLWWKSDPAFSPDGRHLSYSTDRGGKLDIWLHDLTTGADRQLTRLPNAAAVSGSWSRDGRWLAFLDQTGALWTVEVATGALRQLFTATFEPGRPTWSADGRTIALAAIVPYSARYREGLSKILLVDVATGAGRYADPLPDRSIQTRGDDGPVWSPDGTRLAYVVASVLWVVRVDADGTFAGRPRQVTDEVTDAPVWRGDDELLYLHNGTFRLVSASGGAPRPVPMPLTWANSQPRGRTVIRAGRLWDGTSRRLERDVTVVVEGHRIASVSSSPQEWDGRVVDARDAVVIPGLIDMHHHREMQGYSYGARQGRLWLSLGVTTTRSPGSPAYHMVEERESIQSGARIGPRYFGTGEAVDGPRIYYNFMRPTFSPAQLALELSRAGALDYDLMKAYVRLPPVWQRRVIDWAHRHGVPATSHYHYPALNFGGDQMEHVGATSRFGYSRTVSTLGAVYPEVRKLFVAAGARLTPTLFTAATLLVDDDALATDPRVQALYPPWEYAALQAQIAAGRATDQTPTRENLARQVEHLTRLIRSGGHVVNGTDSPIAANGISTHLNLRAMVRYGMTTYEALSTATRAAGEFLAEPLGRVAPGHYADLTILNADPLADIANASDVRAVVTNGVPHTVSDLIEPFAHVSPPESAVAPFVRRADDPHWWHDPHWVEEGRNACCAQTS